ncbi:hypothetical protein DIPPA_01045 [Diplonema papillatum]|nr:hypothetical protein DIPPA_01045 [Diplonema papillatum]
MPIAARIPSGRFQLQKWMRQREFSDVHAKLDAMQGEGLRVCSASYKDLIARVCHMRNRPVAMSLLSRMEEEKILPNSAHVAPVVKLLAFGKLDDVAKIRSALKIMRRARGETVLSPVLADAILGLFARLSDAGIEASRHHAAALLDEMRKSNIGLGPGMVRSLIRLSPSVNSAFTYYDKLSVKDDKTRTALLAACASHGDSAAAAGILEHYDSNEEATKAVHLLPRALPASPGYAEALLVWDRVCLFFEPPEQTVQPGGEEDAEEAGGGISCGGDADENCWALARAACDLLEKVAGGVSGPDADGLVLLARRVLRDVTCSRHYAPELFVSRHLRELAEAIESAHDTPRLPLTGIRVTELRSSVCH